MTPPSESPTTLAYHRLAVFLSFAVVGLISAGALVTSKEAGLAVPDWPLSYGGFNPPRWWQIENVRAEHGHRLIAGCVALLTMALALWIARREPRQWVRRVAYAAVGAVLLQALLGGMTVLFFLPIAISVSHAGLAQIFLCLVVTTAVVTSPAWRRRAQEGSAAADARVGELAPWATLTTTLIYIQILVGAVMRHSGAGLAIPDFPLAFGRWIPPEFNFAIGIHYTHRIGALLVCAAVLITAGRVLSRFRSIRGFVWPAVGMLLLVALQVTLGAMVVLTRKAVLPNTIHVATGATLLAISALLTLNAWHWRGLTRAPGPASVREVRSVFADFRELAKLRITSMVVVTAGIGFLLASRGGEGWSLLVAVLLGTALVSAGGSALNHVLERESDGRMQRTLNRPLPAGRMDPDLALFYGVLLSVIGLGVLVWQVNLLTALLGVVALSGYVFVYTPLKRKSSLSTLVGAVPGALPPVMGWTAVTGHLEMGAWVLFGILFFWQLPHFLAIAWLCRSDYAQAGFPMITVQDPDGARTARQMILHCAALLPVSLMPTVLGLTGALYFVGTLLLGLAFMSFCVVFARTHSMRAARRLMLYSVLYLPAVLAVMVLDRVA